MKELERKVVDHIGLEMEEKVRKFKLKNRMSDPCVSIYIREDYYIELMGKAYGRVSIETMEFFNTGRIRGVPVHIINTREPRTQFFNTNRIKGTPVYIIGDGEYHTHPKYRVIVEAHNED